MTEAMRGLRVRPQYEDLIEVAKSDGLGNIKLPTGDAILLRDGFILSQLDGEGMRQMQLRTTRTSNERNISRSFIKTGF